jgi:hypothetical protein
MTRRPADTARRAGLIAVAVALGAALAAARARLAGRDTGGALAPRLRRHAETLRGRTKATREQTYTCDCGARYRVSGTDRHRVYWPAGAPEGAPVLGDRCVQCEAPFPGGHATRPT